ncbi:ubiquinol-cytochrome c reductase cytochrome c1 subunit [Paracoccus laeviglucosivorans]|uniref:Cytochrome c1 n=1 Tax=Paracoccus laeviglucosivorans TaxID=1197861 RepID=A0A521FGM5_9RHOB|nr:ubiquinol-cytochrome c reductase cytochrome c1 subunit [Paracoccus laeviglucosivorans]
MTLRYAPLTAVAALTLAVAGGAMAQDSGLAPGVTAPAGSSYGNTTQSAPAAEAQAEAPAADAPAVAPEAAQADTGGQAPAMAPGVSAPAGSSYGTAPAASAQTEAETPAQQPAEAPAAAQPVTEEPAQAEAEAPAAQPSAEPPVESTTEAPAAEPADAAPAAEAPAAEAAPEAATPEPAAPEAAAPEAAATETPAETPAAETPAAEAPAEEAAAPAADAEAPTEGAAATAEGAHAEAEGQAASHAAPHIEDISFSFEGPFGSYDQFQLQRGLQVYTEVCSACHGLRYVPLRTLGDPGGPGLPEDQVRAYAGNLTIMDEETGEERPRAPTDHFPTILDEGMGPDLSLMAKARAAFHGPLGTGIAQLFKGTGGPEYIHAILVGYNGETKDEAGSTFYHNAAFSTGWIKMPPPLSDGQVTYEDGTEATVDQMSRDVAAFLMWTAEPKMMDRKQVGFVAVLLLGVLAALLYYTNKKLWAPQKGGRKPE